MRWFPALLFVLYLPASAAAQDSWTSKPSLPWGMCGHDMASLDGYIYSLGGYVSPNSAFRLDPVLGLSWTSIASLPSPANGCSAASINGRIYVFGCQYYPPYYTADAIQCYNPAANRWDVLTTKLGVPRGESAAVRHGSSIFIIGGYGGTDPAAVEEFRPDPVDPLSATITPRASMPYGTYRGAAGSIDGRIYFVYSWGPGDRATFEYTPGLDSWATKAEPPMGIMDMPGAFVLQSRLYMTCGNWYEEDLGTWEYFPMMDLWTQRTTIPTGAVRYYAAGAAVNGKGYVTGGEGINGGSYMVFPNCDEYTPPSFGKEPSPPADLEQRIPGGAAVAEGGTIGVNVEFAAQVTDPEGDDARLEIEAVPAGTAFTGEPTHYGSVAPTGGTLTVTAPFAGGSWQWRARARDVNGNSSGWVDFGDPAVVDFLVDTVGPPAPSGLTPVNEDAPVYDRGGGQVVFAWTAVADDLPGAVTYEMEISYDPSFGSVSASSPSVTTSVGMHLSPSNVDRFWRVRARDVAGNAGAWSVGHRFRVVFIDTVDHGAGDGVCASSASGSAGSAAFLGLLIAAAAAVRRR